jgi:predicted O-methyltransferase YrrM
MKRRQAITRITLAIGAVAAPWPQRAGRGRRGGGGLGANILPLAKDDEEKRILSIIAEMDAKGMTYLSVPPQDGRWLRVLTESSRAQHVVEIGTSTGYSGLWFSLALKGAGGKLTTFEIDSGRAQTARDHFRQAGVDARITIILGDAHSTVKTLAGPIDLVFIDADKEGYPDYFNQLEPLVRPGGLILAHNVTASAEYLKAVTSNPRLETVFYAEGGELSVTLKKI